MQKFQVPNIIAGEKKTLALKIGMFLAPGTYFLNDWLADTSGSIHDQLWDALKFEVKGNLGLFDATKVNLLSEFSLPTMGKLKSVL